ncbi:hypothetical protein BDZ88DRAFT_510572 [Geranomyces variabilis]|nr:hypothetical protein BDZ88DRAFT_510572 [Geranomyces variabilis]
MATVCITALAGSAAIAPTPTSTAFPPGTTSVGSTFGVPPDRLCAGKYSFNYTTYNDGPYSRLTVAMFGPRAWDQSTRWWEDDVIFMLPVGNSGGCGGYRHGRHPSLGHRSMAGIRILLGRVLVPDELGAKLNSPNVHEFKRGFFDHFNKRLAWSSLKQHYSTRHYRTGFAYQRQLRETHQRALG